MVWDTMDFGSRWSARCSSVELDPTDHLFYESLARDGEVITAAAMASYAYDHIDQARRDLNGVS